MTYSFERLTAADAPDFTALLRVFGDAFGDAETYGGAVPSPAYLSGFLGRPQNVVLVGKSGGEVVGGLVAYVLEKFERERSEIYIYDLAVAEAHRRRGIARNLIELLRSVSRELGAYVIYVQADYGDDAAIALYTSLGTREDVMHFDITP
ncbi:MAG TPA: AAC(3)-I family aminoglycoside N-acetyltransferase [Polyangiaceae bacterium]|nr:AAC(3)-I family aminoglycoside N-acetyltransferase [Polyangiaceae bacterium]